MRKLRVWNFSIKEYSRNYCWFNDIFKFARQVAKSEAAIFADQFDLELDGLLFINLFLMKSTEQFLGRIVFYSKV